MKIRALQNDIDRYKDRVVIVEGKKDVAALEVLGFERVYAIHQVSVPIRERAAQIASLMVRGESVSILTDFDRRGRKMYWLLRQFFQENGVNVDIHLRSFISGLGVSHIEGIDKHLRKIEF